MNVTVIDDRIGSWDLATNAANGASTGTTAPTGANVLYFDGDDSYSYTIPTPTPTVLAQSMTIFAAFDAPFGQAYIVDGSVSTASPYILRGADGFVIGAGAYSITADYGDYGLDPAQWTVIAATFNNSDSRLRVFQEVTGWVEIDGIVGSSGLDGISVGASDTGATFLDGDIGAIVITADTRGTANVACWENYLSAKYVATPTPTGIATSTPTQTPTKTPTPTAPAVDGSCCRSNVVAVP